MSLLLRTRLLLGFAALVALFMVVIATMVWKVQTARDTTSAMQREAHLQALASQWPARGTAELGTRAGGGAHAGQGPVQVLQGGDEAGTRQPVLSALVPAAAKYLAVGTALVEGQTAEVNRLEQALADSLHTLHALMAAVVAAVFICAAFVSWRVARGLGCALAAAGAAAPASARASLTSRWSWVGLTRSAR